jgi:hypothetical protein
MRLPAQVMLYVASPPTHYGLLGYILIRATVPPGQVKILLRMFGREAGFLPALGAGTGPLPG